MKSKTILLICIICLSVVGCNGANANKTAEANEQVVTEQNTATASTEIPKPADKNTTPTATLEAAKKANEDVSAPSLNTRVWFKNEKNAIYGFKIYASNYAGQTGNVTGPDGGSVNLNVFLTDTEDATPSYAFEMCPIKDKDNAEYAYADVYVTKAQAKIVGGKLTEVNHTEELPDGKVNFGDRYVQQLETGGIIHRLRVAFNYFDRTGGDGFYNSFSSTNYLALTPSQAERVLRTGKLKYEVYDSDSDSNVTVDEEIPGLVDLIKVARGMSAPEKSAEPTAIPEPTVSLDPNDKQKPFDDNRCIDNAPNEPNISRDKDNPATFRSVADYNFRTSPDYRPGRYSWSQIGMAGIPTRSYSNNPNDSPSIVVSEGGTSVWLDFNNIFFTLDGMSAMSPNDKLYFGACAAALMAESKFNDVDQTQLSYFFLADMVNKLKAGHSNQDVKGISGINVVLIQDWFSLYQAEPYVDAKVFVNYEGIHSEGEYGMLVSVHMPYSTEYGVFYNCTFQ